MNNSCSEELIDLRTVPPRQRHSIIFASWGELPEGEALVLVNDHDPLPLYFQFSCEFGGSFHWEYLEQGPDAWRIRLRKGRFADPGFVPTPPAKSTRAASAPSGSSEPLVVDTRPIFSRGETPCQAIDEAVAQLVPGQGLTLLVPFEPVPLYSKLAAQGFTHRANRIEDGTWRVEFRPA